MVFTPRAKFSIRFKKITQSPKKATSSKVYFYQLFLKVLQWTREMRLRQPCVKKFARNPIFPLKDPNFYTVIVASEKFLNCSSGHVGYSFESHALLFCWKFNFFLLKFRKQKNNNFSMLFSQLFLSTHVNRCFDTTE